jgi:hypothetical protein
MVGLLCSRVGSVAEKGNVTRSRGRIKMMQLRITGTNLMKMLEETPSGILGFDLIHHDNFTVAMSIP